MLSWFIFILMVNQQDLDEANDESRRACLAGGTKEVGDDLPIALSRCQQKNRHKKMPVSLTYWHCYLAGKSIAAR
ncbi:hypothetical protein [Shewanella pealeana]|uniref:hypothetical protein n=1 Tax=Shewanella pealeana TaxID=70864 RepID=UPI00059DC612|nr:hypothetical protein [Shewanella pealeana]